jgi:hypothetical protein
MKVKSIGISGRGEYYVTVWTKTARGVKSNAAWVCYDGLGGAWVDEATWTVVPTDAQRAKAKAAVVEIRTYSDLSDWRAMDPKGVCRTASIYAIGGER